MTNKIKWIRKKINQLHVKEKKLTEQSLQGSLVIFLISEKLILKEIGVATLLFI